MMVRMSVNGASLVMISAVTLASSVAAQARPVKLEPETRITAGLEYPHSVAVTPEGDIFITEAGNGANRVKELGPNGEFILVFGKEVDATTKANVCTAASHDICQAGVAGGEAGALNIPESLALDPNAPHNLYVEERGNLRVDEYTTSGEFVLTFGKEVDATTKANVCTAASHDICQAGVAGAQSTSGSHEPGAFKFIGGGNALAIGGTEDRLYVGDEQRVQEFDAQGKWKGEISLSASQPEDVVHALAVDGSGHVYAVYYSLRDENVAAAVVHKYDPDGQEVKDQQFPFALSSRSREGEAEPAVVVIGAIAFDPPGSLEPDGLLAVAAQETYSLNGNEVHFEPRGSLYDGATGVRISDFTPEEEAMGVVFHGEAQLYAAANHALVIFKHVNVGEPKATEARCTTGSEDSENGDVTLACKLEGTMNPWGVPKTEYWFDWGMTEALGEEIPVPPVTIKEPPGEVPIPVSVEVHALPATTLYYRIATFDENVPSTEEPLTSYPLASKTTSLVEPRMMGAPSVRFVRAQSAILFAELNPENAPTRYSFQYAQAMGCEAWEREVGRSVQVGECPGVLRTPMLETAAYGRIGTTAEASGLQPATTYRYQLVAASENAKTGEKAQAVGSEGSFTTTAAPRVQVTTGGYSSVGATSARIAGVVDPDGAAATYVFELGVYSSSSTQFGVVASGTVSSGGEPVEESVALSGLQLGTTYAYRISAKDGYGEASGATVTFTTADFPPAIVPPTPFVFLPVPCVVFPAESTPKRKCKTKRKCKRGSRPDVRGRCVATRKRKAFHRKGKKKKRRKK